MNYIENNALYYRNHHHHGGTTTMADITTMEDTITMITIIITEVDGAGVEAHGAVAFPRKFCWRCVRWAYSWRINGCSRWRLLSSTIPSNISSAISSTVPSNLFSAISNTISVLNKKEDILFLFNKVFIYKILPKSR